MKRNIIIICLLLGLSLANAQVFKSTTKVGTTAAQFLKIGAGAKPLGMGGAFSAYLGDINSIYWNPASISRIYGGEATFNHANWLADIKYDFFAVAFDLGDLGTIGGSIVSMNVPDDIVRTYSHPDGDGRVFDAGGLAIGLSFAKNLTDRFSIGITTKIVREWIWNESALGMAIDFGTLYITPFNDLKIGASISNFGTKMELDGRDLEYVRDMETITDNGVVKNIPSLFNVDSYEMPLTFRVGLSMDVFKTDLLRATAALDAIHPNDNSEYLNSGLEIGYDEMIFARVGYKSLFMKDSEGGLTVGAGLNYNLLGGTFIKFDYAFADYGRLKNVHFISVSVKF
ncbi:MAG TPA: PorV/PorQ family protein [Ignavibacteria bacterium]